MGFAGSVADAFYLLNNLEGFLERYPSNPMKACIEFAQQWRTGKQIRNLEASLLLIAKNLVIEMDGSGNVMEVDDCRGVGSGGLYAECAALALLRNTHASVASLPKDFQLNEE